MAIAEELGRQVKRLALLLGLAILGFAALLVWNAREPAAGDRGGFDLFAFFEGTSVSRGTITTLLVDREAFTARFFGERQGEAFRLEERFDFEDGERLQVWHLRAVPGGYEGTVETERADGSMAPPVPVIGVSDAVGVRLAYDGVAPGGGMPLGFRHLMRMQGDGTVANHVVVSRFGLPLATSSVVFAKATAALPSAEAER